MANIGIVPPPVDIAGMGLLLNMLQMQNNANMENINLEIQEPEVETILNTSHVQPFIQQHFPQLELQNAGVLANEIRMLYIGALVLSRLLRVNNNESADVVRGLFQRFAWRGVVCYSTDISPHVEAGIRARIMGMQCRRFFFLPDGDITWEDVHVVA